MLALREEPELGGIEEDRAGVDAVGAADARVDLLVSARALAGLEGCTVESILGQLVVSSHEQVDL